MIVTVRVDNVAKLQMNARIIKPSNIMAFLHPATGRAAATAGAVEELKKIVSQ
jgi:prophage DNA circulation protein